jgi:hypothetical protein
VVACVSPVLAGESTVVRLADERAGVEYTLPCLVEWTCPGSPAAMALSVDGAPAQAAYSAPESGAWRAPIGWTVTAEPG